MVHLEAGLHSVSTVAAIDSVLFPYPDLNMPHGKNHYHLDLPLAWNTLPQCVLVRGWCYIAEAKPVSGIRLSSNKLQITGEITKYRPDVKLAFPDAPNDFTGFEIRGVLPPGRQSLVLELQTEDGSWRPFFSCVAKVQRRWMPLWMGKGSWTELTYLQTSCREQHLPRTLSKERFPPLGLKQALLPKISIVTPSLQQASFLPDTLRSIVHQKNVNCEYVVQDGGSTDGSTEIIRSYAQEGITAWTSEPDAGQADAIMRGFAKTSGNQDDLMSWINSDDFYLPGTLAYVAEFFARNPTVDVIYGHRILVNEASQEIGRWFLPPHDDSVLKRYDFVPQETMFWRRRIWEKTAGLDTSLQFAMDWDLLLRFQAAGAKIVRVPYFLACFRVHSAQKTSAQMETVGQREIDALRTRTFARQVPPGEIENDPVLLRYLRHSAWTRFLWKLGIRR